jgi:hypothetical protein
MKKITFVLLTALFLAFQANAGDGKDKGATAGEQPAALYTLTGKVYDPVCGETIPGAAVTVDGVTYYSDLGGNFSVSGLNRGKHSLRVDFISYRPQAMEIDLDASRELHIELKQQ